MGILDSLFGGSGGKPSPRKVATETRALETRHGEPARRYQAAERLAEWAADDPEAMDGLLGRYTINAEKETVATGSMTAAAGAPGQVLVQIDKRHSVAVPTADSDSDEPVVVERRRVRVPGQIVTEHVTIVRRGDKILSVFRPDVTQNSANWRKAGEKLGTVPIKRGIRG